MHNFKLLETASPIDKPKTSLTKKIVKFFLYLLLLILLLTGTLITLLFVYEDEVKAIIVKELNKSLKAEVRIDPANIDLTIIKSFPDCSLQFTDLLMLEAVPAKKRDTLLFTRQLNLYFNIEDLWNKHYEIKQVKLKNALVKLVVFKNGKNNYTFWQEAQTSGSNKNDSLMFNLDLLQLEECRIVYKDKQQLIKTDLNIKTMDFKGSFSETNFDMETSGEILIKQITQQKTSFLKEKNLAFKLELNVAGNNYTFKKATLNLNKLALELDGGFSFKDSLQSINVNYKAPDLDISSALSLLPETFKQKINNYGSDGNFYASGNFRYTANKDYLLESSFGIKDGEITYQPMSTKATNINVEGFLKYSSSFSLLEVKNIYLKLNNDEVKGSCIIRNFSEPHLRLALAANLNLENLQNFWPIDTLTTLKGKLSINSSVDGTLEDLKSRTFSNKVKLTLSANVSELEAQFKGDEKIYAIENCSVTAMEREVEVHNLKLKRGSSDLKLNGKMPGLFNYLSDRNAPLIIQGNLFSNYFKMEDFMSESGTSGGSNNNAVIPENVEFKLNAAILKFSFAAFEAQNITGEVEIKNQKAIISDMKLETMEGEAEIDAFADNSNNKLSVILQSDLKNINISKLFLGFNNFGQATLQNKNLKGYASAGINFSGTWSNNLDVDYKSLKANSNISIEQGELIDFQPLLSLGKYLDVNDLKHIKFSNLTSSVEIKDNNIIIPKTSIKNSALDIDLQGTHSFNNYIDYHLRLLFNDWKAKKHKNADSEFGPIAKDLENKRSVFIGMVGDMDNPTIKYDFKGMKQKIGEDIKEERKSMKNLFRDELGLNKKDTVQKPGNGTKKQEQVFELEKPANGQKPKTEPKNKEEDDEDF